MSRLKVHDISFDDELQEDDEYIFIGWDANDRIAIEKTSGRIVAYDSYSDSKVSDCAESGEKFLDALATLMAFVKEKILSNYAEKERDKRSSEVAYITALKAGGEEFESYYRGVLWLD